MTVMPFRIALIVLTLLYAGAAGAQDFKPSKEPIEVTAKKSLEWNRNKKLYIARGLAVAKQGTSELHGDTLTAKYVDGKTGKGSTITRIDAAGNVTVVSDGSTATGDQGYYDVASGYAELTGSNLKLTSNGGDTVTARDKLTYEAGANQANAYGNARATRGSDVITADRLIGRFEKASDGTSKMKEMEAIGNVVITTPTDVLHGDRGIYYAASNTATVTGHVRIDRGPNVITGARGEIDMNTNISKIFGGPATTGTGATSDDGRVRGVFYPDSQ
ncbi:MAG: ostA-like family protein [Rhodospirillales bacterium]|nr:ostA-like family protein [Alphaproteobacteria bacterium]MCB9986901.1 ostA-like family protein [Rhodospirillales bacterium]USO08321.1 MAG: ostA-like family protein [Rhodospirillales bacterium]